MDVMKACDEINAETTHRALGQVFILWDEVFQTTTSTEFYYQPQMVTGFIPLVKLHNIIMLYVMGHTNLFK